MLRLYVSGLAFLVQNWRFLLADTHLEAFCGGVSGRLTISCFHLYTLTLNRFHRR